MRLNSMLHSSNTCFLAEKYNLANASSHTFSSIVSSFLTIKLLDINSCLQQGQLKSKSNNFASLGFVL